MAFSTKFDIAQINYRLSEMMSERARVVLEKTKVTTHLLRLYNLISSCSKETSNWEHSALIDHLHMFVHDKKEPSFERNFINYKVLLLNLQVNIPKGDSECSIRISKFVKQQLEIVNLQRFIPEKRRVLSPKSKFRENIVTAIRSGLLTKGLGKNQNKLLDREFCPYVPFHLPQKNMQGYSIVNAVERLSLEYREAGYWLMSHCRVITLRMLCKSIQTSCITLADEIKCWDTYQVLSIPNKSQKWVADIACRYLPEDHLPLSIETFSITRGLIEHLDKGITDHFLIFDDIMYSGEQVRTMLTVLSGALSVKKNSYSRIKTVYIILGFAQQDKIEQLQRYAAHLSEYNIEVKLIAAQRIESCYELLSRENKSAELRGRVRHLLGGNKIVVTTEWKTPDFLSLPKEIATGKFSPIFLSQSSFVQKLPPCQYPIIPVVPPYKQFGGERRV